MTRTATWLISGACLALLGVVAFFVLAEPDGQAGGRAAKSPRAARAPLSPSPEPAALEHAAEPVAESARPGAAALEAERTRVEDQARSTLSEFAFRVVELGTRAPIAGAAIAYVYKEEGSEVEVPWEFEDASGFDELARRTLADDAGNVRVPRQPGTLFVTAEKDNYWGRATFDVAQEPSAEEQELEVVADWSLTVQVLDGVEQPAAGVPVALGHKSGRWSGASFLGETDANGKHRYGHVGFRMAMEEGGEWSVRLDLLVLEPVRRVLDPQEVVGETVVLRLPPAGSLEVVVREEDGSVPPDGTVVNAGIVAKDQPRDISPFSNHTRDYIRLETTDGSALYPFVGLGQEFEVRVAYAGDRVETRDYGQGPSVAGERREFPVTLGLANPVLLFRAVSEAGAPLGEQELTLEMSFRSNFMSNSWDRTLTTDTEGLFRVDLDGSYEEGDLRYLVVSDGAEPPLTAHVDLAREFAPGPHDMGELALGAAPLLLKGRVVDPLGAPIAGAEIELQAKQVRQEDNVSWDRMEAEGRTDAEGVFEIRGVTPADELHVTASSAGKRGESVLARVGEAGVTLVLYGTGSLTGNVLLDEEVTQDRVVLKAKRSDAQPPPEGMHGNREDQAHPDEEGAFVVSNLIPGTYTVEVALANGNNSLRTIEGVLVADGGPTRDPRLQSIDLRGLLFVHRLVLITPQPVENLQGSLQLKQAGEPEGQRHWQWFNESPVEIVCEHRSIDVELSVRGFSGVQLEGVRGERQVELDDGWPIRLVLRTDGELPAPPIYVKAVLVPLEGDAFASIDWGAPCFDETREVRTRAYGTGRMKVQWLVEKRSSGGGAIATTAEVEPEQFVEVRDTRAEQIIEIEISAEQLAAMGENL